MFAPMWQGLPPARNRSPFVKTSASRREEFLTAWFNADRWSPKAYFAVSPCGRYVKVGCSRNPMRRVRGAAGVWREVEALLGIGHVYLFNAFDGAFEREREMKAFLAPDRVIGEWFRVGPRFRILCNRLSRERASQWCFRNAYCDAYGLNDRCEECAAEASEDGESNVNHDDKVPAADAAA